VHDAAPQDEELLAQEGVLGDEGGPAAREVGDHARRDRVLRERASQGSPELGTPTEEASQHPGLLSAYCW
jgi:hypothetical protein